LYLDIKERKSLPKSLERNTSMKIIIFARQKSILFGSKKDEIEIRLKGKE
jgi:hypothetical protein